MRSFWMRRAMTASAPVSASRRSRATVQPSFSMPSGMSVRGPPTRTLAPSFERQWMLERATLLWAMSPTMATVLFSSVPQRSRRLSASSRPWVGCSCAPSPALITLARTARATSRGAPAAGCRTTSASAPMASRLRTVSSSDSPLATLEASFWKESTSAPSERAATSKELRVRVECSKKRVMMVRPRNSSRRSGSAEPLRALARSSLKRAARSSNSSICSRVSASSSSRWRGKSTSDAMQEPPREMRGKPRLEDLVRRLLRVVGDAVELDHLRRVVPDAEAGARVVVARLAAAADRAEVFLAVLDAQPLAPDVLHFRAEEEGALQVRVADEGQMGEVGGAHQQIFGLLEREDVLEGGRVARRGMAVSDVAFRSGVGQRAQPLHVGGRELLRGPVEHFARRRVVVAVVHPARDCGVVVAEDRELAARADDVASRVGIGAVADGVAQADEAIDLRRVRRCHAR